MVFILYLFLLSDSIMKLIFTVCIVFVLFSALNEVLAQQSTETKTIFVSVSFSEVCPLCVELVPSLKSLLQKNERWCEFTFVLPNAKVNQKKLQQLLKVFPVKPRLVYDTNKTISKRLGFTVTPEVVVENARNEVVYSGAIDDRFVEFGKSKKHSIIPYLSNALDALIQGKKPQIVSTKAFGCYISYKTEKQQTEE